MEQQQIQLKEVLEGAKLGAEAINKENDYTLRAEESRLRNKTEINKQQLKDETKIEEVELKDETQLNEKE